MALCSEVCLALENRDATLGDAEAICVTSTLTGGAAQSTCYWNFAYRSDAALARLDQLRREIEACLGVDAALRGDTQVNHPDSFALYRYEGQGRRVALSLKDKAGLSQSLIFLSISDTP